jgi:hypothetical protein
MRGRLWMSWIGKERPASTRRLSSKCLPVLRSTKVSGTCQFCQFRPALSSATNVVIMALMDLCGISNVLLESHPHYLGLPPIQSNAKSENLQNNPELQKIAPQWSTPPNEGFFTLRRAQPRRHESLPQGNAGKSASSSSPPPLV